MIRKAVIVVLAIGAVGTVALWAHTLRTGYMYSNYTKDSLWVLGVGRGGLSMAKHEGRVRSGPYTHPPPGWHRYRQAGARLEYTCWIPWVDHPTDNVLALDVPLWMPFMLLAAYPTLAFIRGPLRRRRRRKRGECVACGYNLTGNVSGVCPECGAEI